MTKIKKKNIHAPLIITGYTIFVLLVLATLLSTIIPYGLILLNPYSIKINVAIALVALTVGAVLPVLVGYLVGDTAIKSKSRFSHHFNGMLFGLLAYWIMMLAGAYVQIPTNLLPHNLHMILMNLLPGCIVAIVTVVLTTTYVRSRQAKHDVLSYKPFVIVLATSVIATPLLMLIQNTIMQSGAVYSFMAIAPILVSGSVSYLSLRRTPLRSLERLSWTLVSVSVLYAMMFATYMVVPSILDYLIPYSTMEQQTIGSTSATVLAITAWVVYWICQVKALQSGKK